MKRFLTILLTAVMILTTFATTIVNVAATGDGSAGKAPAGELYLSDIAPISWKMFEGCTPGYDVYFEDGTSLALAGVTYEKGLSTHPGVNFDAEFIYDISGYDYTAFTAIVGKTDRYAAALPGSFITARVYVDGVLADEVIDLVAGKTYTFHVNVAGASELKLVTSPGSDNITCDGVVWANVKLNYDKVDPVDPEDSPELYLSDITPQSATALTTPYYNKNEQGEPLLLDGVTYAKGIWTHPLVAGDAVSVYDLSGYSYTTFSAIVGKEQKYADALPGSLLTFRVYVDGVLADEVVNIVAGETYTFMIDITGASELKLVTGKGSDEITCDGSIWANAKLNYDKVDPVDPENSPAEGIYLSDIKPVSWKIIDGSKPGYNVYFEDNTPLALAGKTYAKGLSTHPGAAFDAEFVYDIKGYDYTTFTAIVGKTDRYVAALPGSLTSFQVYVDGVLADEVVDLVAGDTYTFRVNVTGASELKLVSTPGSDNITCDGVIWANAKLIMTTMDCGDHTWENGKVVKEPSCAEVGQMKYQCANCLQEKMEEVPVVPHTVGEWEMGEEANCTEAGTKLQTCSACGEVVSTAVWEAKGHVPSVWMTVESATCTEAGVKAQRCQVCDIVLAEEEIPALGHFYGDWGTLDGKQVRLCECGEQEIRDNQMLPIIIAGAVILLAAGAVTFLVIKKKR